MTKAQTIITQLGLRPHPEGGYFCETYRCGDQIPGPALPHRFCSRRNLGTAIYFLLPSDQVSCFHRLKVDELWHFYAGSALTLHLLTPDGEHLTRALGPDLAQGEQPQLQIPFGSWFGATVDPPESYALVGCTTCPGFEFDDFELADREQLLAAYPRHAKIIRRLTPETDTSIEDFQPDLA